MIVALPFAIYLQSVNRFNIIHIHFAVPAGPVGYVLKLLFSVNYVMTLQGGDVPSFIPEQTKIAFKLIKPLTVPIWKQASGIYAVSNSLAEMAMADYKDVKVGVIYNGVDDDFFQEGQKGYEKINILFVGRISVQKRVDMLLRALALINDMPIWQGHIIGDGPLLSKLKSLSQELGINKRVVFHGWFKKEELKKVLASSHIFVLPSLKEGLPLAGIQAMASGLAVIGADVPGVRDIIINGENGYLFTDGDCSKLSEYISILLKDKDLLQRMGKDGRDKARIYRWPHIAERYMEVYNSLENDKVVEFKYDKPFQ